MPTVEKIVQNLSKGYTPQAQGAPTRIAKIYENTFKPLVNRKKLDTFFMIYDHEDPILKAWGFLGLYQILENQSYESQNTLDKLNGVILDLLNDDREIKYLSGDIETRTTIRKHHVSRVCWLKQDFVFEPVFKYCEASMGKLDKVVSTLLEEVVSKHSDPKVESLLLDYANQSQKHQIFARRHIIKAFENFGEKSTIKNEKEVEKTFKTFLSELKEIPKSDKKRVLKDNIIRIGAKLNLDLEEETLNFLRHLERPYDALKVVAERYKKNKRLYEILQKKLEETKNRNFINDILRAIIVIKDEIPNWKEIVIENVKRNQLNKIDLIMDLNEADLVDQSLILDFLQEGKDWQLEFIREYLITYPETIDKWKDLNREIISILDNYNHEGKELKPDSDLFRKKKMLLQLIIDLNLKELVDYCLKNFTHLNNDELRKMALFSIITFGEDKHLKQLRHLMEENKETEIYVKNFWNYLERRDWKFYY
ncbi:MAG: hypothetical protein BAJALOKI2v1_80038 [Promethearchaeota archaeon]|nr:MAG: hypothetical protein BAJALOKI2v1_80038 [Candidatus Lokiarchaeota archaeon]